MLETLFFFKLLDFFYYYSPSTAPKRPNSIAVQSVQIRLGARASTIIVCSVDCKEKQKIQGDEKQIRPIGKWFAYARLLTCKLSNLPSHTVL